MEKELVEPAGQGAGAGGKPLTELEHEKNNLLGEATRRGGVLASQMRTRNELKIH